MSGSSLLYYLTPVDDCLGRNLMTRDSSIRRRMSEAEEGAINRSKGPPKRYISMPHLTYNVFLIIGLRNTS